MARLRARTLACISLLYLLSSGLEGRPRTARARAHLIRTSFSILHPRHPAPQPMTSKLQKAPWAPPAVIQALQEHSRPGPSVHRPRDRLLRVGCLLATCQVQNLGHRLWRLRQASRLDPVPVDPGNPHSYG
ncbi:PREDICTED: ADM2 [Elephantulus edwardii]|uniref:ADM2 n=1 Tax=Elephantulus edwardii TaxID=28737 RepID=UPI0003F06205|nr:PREDICTED: ADM2 [Elephantulus edwardii]